MYPSSRINITYVSKFVYSVAGDTYGNIYSIEQLCNSTET